MDFGKTFEAFCKGLEGQTMIRATKGTSMDGWMDGWMDGGVLIRYLSKWMIFRRPLGLDFRGRVRCRELRVR